MADRRTPAAEPAGRLPRSVGLGGLVAFGLAFMVPIAPFGVFGAVYAASGGRIVAAYLVGLGVMLLVAGSFAVMAREFTGVGSVHTYVGRAVGPAAGFLAGWLLLLDYLLVPSLICVLAANAMHAVLPAVPAGVFVVAVGVTSTAANLAGVREAVRLSTVLLGVQFAVLAAFVVAAVAHLAGRPAGTPVLDPVLGSGPGTAVLAGTSVAVLSFLGFESIATLAEENRRPPAAVGRAMRLSLGLCAALFALQCWLAALLVADPAGLASGGDPQGSAFYDVARLVGGPALAWTCALCVALAGISNAVVAQAATARLLVAFARGGDAPRVLARVGRAPGAATIVVAAVTLAVAGTTVSAGGLHLLVSLVDVGALGAFAALHLAVVVHFGLRPGRRPVAHLLVPVAGTAAIGAVVVASADVARELGAAWLALGVVIVGVRRVRARAQPP